MIVRRCRGRLCVRGSNPLKRRARMTLQVGHGGRNVNGNSRIIWSLPLRIHIRGDTRESRGDCIPIFFRHSAQRQVEGLAACSAARADSAAVVRASDFSTKWRQISSVLSISRPDVCASSADRFLVIVVSRPRHFILINLPRVRWVEASTREMRMTVEHGAHPL